MDGFKDKKWFVYIGDHHEGPFSLEEIQGKMSAGIVTATHYVWAEGMGDWQQMKEVTDFGAILHENASAQGSSTKSLAPQLKLVEPAAVAVSAVAATVAVSEPPVQAQEEKIEPTVAFQAPMVQITSAKRAQEAPATAASRQVPQTKKPQSSIAWGRMLRLLMVLGFLGGVGAGGFWFATDPEAQRAVEETARPILIRLSEKIPALNEWFSPIPEQTDLSVPDQKELVEAAKGSPEAGSLKVAVALSQADLFLPVFVLASNTPEETVFDISVEGIPDTLLNRTAFVARVRAVVKDRLGRSEALRAPDGKPISRGEYRIKVLDPQNERVALTEKVIFLGGAKDETYRERLVEYHDRLNTKAKAEREELRQFVGSLLSQLSATENEFEKVMKPKPNPKLTQQGMKAWQNFHGQWVAFHGQFEQATQAWVPDRLKNEFFYDILYVRLKEAGEAVAGIHQLHADFAGKKTEWLAQRDRVQQQALGARAVLESLKQKIDQAEAIPPSPTGMPMKNGLE